MHAKFSEKLSFFQPDFKSIKGNKKFSFSADFAYVPNRLFPSNISELLFKEI